MAHEQLRAALEAADIPDGLKAKMASLLDGLEVKPAAFFGGYTPIRLKVLANLSIWESLTGLDGPVDKVYTAGDIVEVSGREAYALLEGWPDFFELEA